MIITIHGNAIISGFCTYAVIASAHRLVNTLVRRSLGMHLPAPPGAPGQADDTASGGDLDRRSWGARRCPRRMDPRLFQRQLALQALHPRPLMHVRDGLLGRVVDGGHCVQCGGSTCRTLPGAGLANLRAS